ncbi:hypothetical protein GCM10009780_25310 [Actinomadura alba]
MPFGAHAACDFEPVELGQAEIEDNEIHTAPERSLQGLRPIGADFNVVPLPSQRASKGLRDGRVVLGEQY